MRESWGQRLCRDWNRFWFHPSDPTLLGLIRVTCGILTVYTLLAFSFDLQAFLGEDAWLDLTSRLKLVRETPISDSSLAGNESPLPSPRTPEEANYVKEYVTEFKELPPGPYPRNDEEKEYCRKFRRHFNFDLRYFGLPPPQNESQRNYLESFASRFGFAPAPPYPTTEEQAQAIFDYTAQYRDDPNRLIAKGSAVWSLWFYVTDPLEMKLLHAAFIAVAILFMIGFCTRITSVLTWFAFLNYVNRAPQVLFGADTMMSILLFYLAIGPSGAALSVDRLLRPLVEPNKLRVLNAWRRLGHKPPLTAADIRPVHFQEMPRPLVGANLAIRLLQMHLCIIYLVAGVAKLLGPSWWSGTAVWGALANFEFAPMHWSLYNETLRFLGHNQLVFSLFLFTGTYFTLVFEIGYAFLIWNPRFRWLYLASAILLHGFIGTLMGLKTFALIMLVMNMAFLRDSEAHWIVDKVCWFMGCRQFPR